MFAVPWHERTDLEVLERHGTQSDQCVKPTRLICKIACVFSNAVTLLMALLGASKIGAHICCDLCTQELIKHQRKIYSL